MKSTESMNKKPYHTPKLSLFGDIYQITKSNPAGMSQENPGCGAVCMGSNM